ncbi:MAG: NADH-quinone oxidoreductase subunit D, partial [candidate division Zixibacteria bacterium]|nr:NADH-quinone oxidoreductase subunit D [candidate division Zixibacteria bacterium]
ISAEDAIDCGVTGPSLRASGVDWDLRRDMPYTGYENYKFEVPLGKNGDVYDRYLVRIKEMRQSLKIVEQALGNIPAGPHIARIPGVTLPPKEDVLTNMESLIYQFKVVVHGMRPPEGEIYQAIESPRGELGFYVCSDGTGKPYRVHVRAPSFVNLSALHKMVQGGLMADVIATIGSIDIVLGEVDR